VAEHRPAETEVRFIVTDQDTGARVCFARCPHCGRSARVAEERLGKPVKCRSTECGVIFVIRHAPHQVETIVPAPKKGG
jgi:hypothetical protein